MRKCENTLNSSKGITLIALVVTIVVLLILAGVSIAALTGNSGLLTKVSESKTKTEEAQEKEGVGLASTAAQISNKGYQALNQSNLQNAIDEQFGKNKAIVTGGGGGSFTVSFIDSKRDYNITSYGVENGINWNEAMANAEAPGSQVEERNDGVIGIGTDGEPVNMDLWEYTLLDNGTYALNSTSVMDDIKQNNWDNIRNGYIGTFYKGKIVGTIPQYIKSKNDNNFIKVTELPLTFANCMELVDMPRLPSTIDTLNNTFLNCSNLTNVTAIPNSVIKMISTFSRCTSLEIMPELSEHLTFMPQAFYGCSSLISTAEIPSSVTDLEQTFMGCSQLSKSPNIPENVTTLSLTFYGCSSLKEISSNIPSTVKDMNQTFSGCSSLDGLITINADLTGKMVNGNQNDYFAIFFNAGTNDGCQIKLTGTCPMLQEIVQQTNNHNITLT